MTELTLYNTLARAHQPFRPIEPGRVRIYVCGMTVYDYCHLGHARVLVAFDVITRYLRARGYAVDYVRNITDVDDKILQRAVENDETPESLTTRFIDAMHEDERALGVLPPDHEPRATGHIDDIIAMVQVLVDKGYAYRADNGDVYYAVAKFADYGKLSGKDPDELLAGARVDVDEHKRDPRDFALWKAAKPHEPVQWPSPWGAGRPGWHIECSAMSKRCLGAHFDIHGGGPDLQFPHHENEIAQSEAANDSRFVNYWLHAGAVRINGEKMSKSLGNFFTIREILARYRAEVVRYLLIASHYRSAINYSPESLETARGALERLYTALRGVQLTAVPTLMELPDSSHRRQFVAAMDDDFNTPRALAVLFDLAREINTARDADDREHTRDLARVLRGLAGVLGLLADEPEVYLRSGGKVSDGDSEIDNGAIEALIDERSHAKRARDYARADEIRAELAERGIVLEDTRGGTTWRRE